MIKTLAIVLAVLAIGVWAAPAVAEQEVDLELVLAVDISLSMDEDELELQREGYANAFRDPEVLKAIRSGGYGRIAVTYLEWAGVASTNLIIDWAVIDGPRSAEQFAAALEAAPLNRRRRTSISNGLETAAKLFEDNGVFGLRRVIDVSGDGPNNQGERVDIMRDRLVSQGIIINGLPLLLNRGRTGFFDIPNLDEYYTDCVIGGTGAFVLPVRDIKRFGAAIRQKLVLEIAGRVPLVVPAQATETVGGADCLVGEKIWLDWRSRGFGDP